MIILALLLPSRNAHAGLLGISLPTHAFYILLSFHVLVIGFLIGLLILYRRYRGGQARLQDREERYRFFIQNSPGIAHLSGMNSIPLIFDGAVEQITGYTTEQFLAGTPRWDQVILPEEFEKIKESWEKIATIPDYSTQREYRIRHKDGSIRWVMELVQNTCDQSGKPVRIMGTLYDVTERKLVENRLKQERDRAQTYLDVAGTMFVVIDKNQQVALVNKKGCEILECREQEIIGQNWFDQFLPKRMKKEVKSVFEQLMAGKIEPVEYYENPIVTRNGNERLIAWHNTILKNSEGVPYGTLSSGEDITERKRAENEVRQAREAWENIFQAIGSPAFILDTSHHIISANRAAVTATGIPLEQLAGKRCFELFHQADEPPANCPVKKLLETKQMQVGEMEVEALHGTFLVSCTPVFKPNGDLENIIHIATDITDRKKAETALQESEEQFRTLADQSPNMIFINQRGKVVYVNQQCETLTGYSRDTLCSPDFNFMDLISPEYHEAIQGYFRQHSSGHDVPPYEYTLIAKDGKKMQVINSSRLITYRGQPAILGTVTDITEQKQTEEKLRASLKEKEVLLQEVHHRVKNNMQIITSLLSLQSKYIKDPKDLALFNDSRQRVRSMALIHEQLYQVPDLARVDLDTYIKNIARELYRVYGVDPNRITLNTDMGNISIPVNQAIPCGLVINELISNSLKYAFPPGKKGVVTVTFKAGKPAAAGSQGSYLLTVTDNGVGLPPDLDLDHTDSLGLYLVKMLVEDQLEGSLAVDRADGTTFRITFTGSD